MPDCKPIVCNSPRAHHHVLKVAGTIADLAIKQDIKPSPLAEAMRYRCLDRVGTLH